ncbi:protein quiver [Aplysia californica]|uniref:Protein quiver n=1 Tax=Aplysia californica TaxID=6500 RepID=A0ABM1ACB8_APLCA|nr:protein quiver [Aplysia californica]
MIVLAISLLFVFGVVSGQDDYSVPIKCYTCEGAAENSTCADPLDVNHSEIQAGIKTCEQGICLKWTKYKQGKLQMIRTCTADLNFHLTMIDGVCRTERNGNGYLCMCGKNMCNMATGRHVTLWRPPLALTLLLMCYALVPGRLRLV